MTEKVGDVLIRAVQNLAPRVSSSCLTCHAEAVMAKEVMRLNQPRSLGFRHTCCPPAEFIPGTSHIM